MEEVISELPYDIVEAILLKLSVKSLVRLKGVSKTWKDVISGPNFVYRRWRESRRAGKICPSYVAFRHCRVPEYKKYFVHFSLSLAADQDEDYDVERSWVDCKTHEIFSLPYISCETKLSEGAINQLYPAGFGIYAIFELKTEKVALWNPTMRQLKVLPPSPYHYEDENVKYHYGFAHIEYKDGVFSYKVGVMRTKFYEADILHALTIELYSSTDNTWRLMEDCYQFRCLDGIAYDGRPYAGRNLDGKFHWLTWFSKYNPHIVTFDLSTGEFGRLEVPPFLGHDSTYIVTRSILTQFDDKYLCLLLYRKNDNYEVSIEAWVMFEYGITESWTKQSTVGPIADRYCDQVLDGISCDNNYKVGGVFFLDLGHGEGLYFCQYGSKEADTVLYTPTRRFELTCDVIEYEESLISLDGISDRRTELSSTF